MDRGTSTISLGVLLTVLFVALKLTGHITWSWLWVMSPLFIVPAVSLAVAFIVLLAIFIGGLVMAATMHDKRRK